VERVNELQMAVVLPPEKLPKFYTTAQSRRRRKENSANPPSDNSNDPNQKKKGRFGQPERPKAEGRDVLPKSRRN